MRSSKQTKTHGIRNNEKKSTTKEAGARLVANKTRVTQSDHNERTYLPDAMTALLPSDEKKTVYSAMVIDMPAEGDMSIFHIANALSKHGLSLERVSGKYNQKSRASYHLLKEKDCKLIANTRLIDLKGNILSHFVAWNGKVIIDHPNSSKVNDTTTVQILQQAAWHLPSCFQGTHLCCGRSPV